MTDRPLQRVLLLPLFAALLTVAMLVAASLTASSADAASGAAPTTIPAVH